MDDDVAPTPTTDYTAEEHRMSMDLWRESVRISSSSSCLVKQQSRQSEVLKLAIVSAPQESVETSRQYKGRIRTWPGLVLFALLIAGAVTFIVVKGKSDHDAARERVAAANAALFKNMSGSLLAAGIVNSIIATPDEDGVVGNPKTYPPAQCGPIDFQSKNGKLVAVLANGTETSISIKGVNWFGMETGLAIPFGLWQNAQNGTTAYVIAAFLAANNFNAVRLPVCITSILKNTPPEKGLVNLQTNRALDLTSYMTALQSIIKTLAYRRVGVLISLHTLTTTVSGGNWYDESLGVSKDDFLTAVDKLTKNLCSNDYWNIIGLDAKNEPHQASWSEFSAGATTIGNRMLKGCPKWTLFVEGVNQGTHSVNIGGQSFEYFDWWGGGLQQASAMPVTLSTPNKIVYAPHYYNTGVFPQTYFYSGGTSELDDATLKQRVQGTSFDMFGYLNKKQDAAVVLGEFAGLYATDASPMKTTKRTTDFLIQIMVEEKYAGGFMWSLNPESAYQYNPNPGTYTEGLLLDDWLTPNTVFVKGMAAMDAMPNVQLLPCVPVPATTAKSP
ncbi:Aste57867_20392 [Aphanomyces stellatus]|uniref:Aste57867_20392 protein n=1 Tax=Aphanomyces stellatus TaxID=120398 RepID=A0A485LJK2_9STRA|nr:hypothetical protein As57867_020326 [Aphanomyces stellatus]VFT97078.1 Aste57867_20392 [Aphanomyces stellatus]